MAIAMNATGKTSSNNIQINVEGGKLEVTFEKENEIYKNVLLKGKAEFVYEGAIFL